MVTIDQMAGVAERYSRLQNWTDEEKTLAALLHAEECLTHYDSRGCRLGHLLRAKEYIEIHALPVRETTSLDVEEQASYG